MKIVNLFGGPGVGKSTLAAGLFFNMKQQGLQCELVTEYAKDVTWEGRDKLLSDQLYLFAKQNRRLVRLLDHPIEYAITDSPVLLCAAYAKLNGVVDKQSNLVPLILEVFASYDNINIVLQRDPTFYSQTGRSQTLDQAHEIDNVVVTMLDEFKLPYHSIAVGENAIQAVLRLVTAQNL